MINAILAEVHLTVAPVDPGTYSVVISLVLKCIIGIDIFSMFSGFLTFGEKTIIMRKFKWKPLEGLLGRKIVK